MQKKVSLYVYDSLSDWEYGYLAPGINDSTFQNAPERLVVETCASSLDPITTAGGIRKKPAFPGICLSRLPDSQSPLNRNRPVPLMNLVSWRAFLYHTGQVTSPTMPCRLMCLNQVK